MGLGRNFPVLARVARWLALAICAVAIGFLAGRGTVAETPPAAGTARPPSGDRSHTPEGAVAAYLIHQQKLGDPRVWLSASRKRARSVERAVASVELRRSIERSMEKAIDGRDPLGRALRSGGGV